MSVGLVGRKRGMTRVFTETGESIPVTVIEVSPNRITQVKTQETDGYSAIQITAGDVKSSRLSKPMSGHFAKAGVNAGFLVKEFPVLGDANLADYKVGDELTVSLFEVGQYLDVQGTSKGKGFQGGVKRHNFRMQDATHGNSLSHRALGSVGQCQTPGRVFKGKKMAGQMGNVTRTAVNQEVVQIDSENNVLLIKGSIPGAPNGIVTLKQTTKQKGGK